MNKLKKIRFEVISQNILDNIKIREIEFGNLKFYHNNDRTNNINITSDLSFNGIITNNTTEYNTIVNGDFNNYLIIDKNTAIFEKFIEFDFDLNYDIPNFLNSLSYTKLYWNTSSDIYTDERIYPSQYARLNYFDKIDGNSSDIYIIENSEYDNGIYEIAYSTRYNSTNHSPHYVFSSQNITYHNDAIWQNNQYNNGEYIGNHFFNNLGYYGDWITIKMPVNIIPTKIRFVSILFNSSYTNRLPKKYRLYGYFNYVWELIIDDYIDDDYEYETYNSIPNIAYTKNIENAKNYNKYALIVNKIGNTHVLAMSNFEIFGREVLEEKWISNHDSDVISNEPVTTPLASINTLDSNYKYVVFQNTGDNQTSYNITFTESTACDILIVGGGGSGGVRDAGAGGAGGLIYLNNVNILNSNLSVGKGGASRTSGGHISGYKGNDSSIVIDGITYTAEGGGKGGQFDGSNNNSTGSGGSGGGGGGRNSAGGTGNQTSSTSGGYGNDGARGSGSYSGGGGGGAGGEGTRHSGDTGGNGGIGMDFSAIFGTEYGDDGWFAGGGGMGSGSGANGTGGLGGGGNGANSGAAEGGMDGTGGGGGGHRSSGGTSGKGGDGIIIIRYSYNNQSLNFLELKTKILDNDNNIIELNNTVLNREELIHGIKNGIMTSYNMTKYVLFKEERLYPPYYKSEILLFENFFIENKIYGNGQYKIEYSSSYYENNKPLNIFRNNYYNAMWQSNNYTWNNKQKNTLLARSLFNGTSYLKDESYKGEWITINLPYKILLTKIILALLNSNELDQKSYDNAIYHFPHNFRIYGKNNNDEEWELIIHKNIDKSNLNNKYDNENNLNVAFEYKLSDNDRFTKFKTFENYGLVVSEIGGNEYLNFSKWDIYGRELTSILDNKPDNIPSKKNIKFSHLSKVFDDDFDNKNINIRNYYKDNLYKYDHNISIPNDGIISLSNFKNTSSFIDNIPFADNIYARYETKYESLYILDNIVKQWYDSSGNNRHIIVYRGNPIVKYFERGTKGTIGKNYFNVIKGDYDSGYKLPFRLNFDYTFCYVARYVGDKNNTTYNRRIFDSSSGIGQNTSWGFHNNYSGISHNYKSGWHTTTNKQHTETDYWMIGIETQNTARYNGQDCTNYYEYKGINYPQKYTDYNVQLTINYGYYTGETYSTETSNWEIAEMIFYNKELNLDEKINVEQYLAKKCGHISFSSVVDNLEDYKTIIKSQNYVNDLSDMWYYVYDGYKYGYSDLTDKFYGPAGSRFNFLKYDIDFDIKNIKNYWVAEFKNEHLNVIDNNYTVTDIIRNSYNIKYNNIQLANSDENYFVHMIALGGGGGGGKSKEDDTYKFSGGGGAGGLSYITNKTLKNKIINLEIGSKGIGGTNINNNSAGGDTKISFDTTEMIGKGGYSGNDYGTTDLSLGGDYSGGDGGDYGGNSTFNGYNMSGGKISEVLKDVYIEPTHSIQFWELLDEFNIYWKSINIEYVGDNLLYPGCGGYGARKYALHKNEELFASNGGSGYAMIILDFNDLDVSRTSSIINKNRIFEDYFIDFESYPGRVNTPQFAQALGGNTNMGFRNNYHGWYAWRSRGHIWTIVPKYYNTADVNIGKWSGTGINIYIYRDATITSDWWGTGTLIHNVSTSSGNETFTFTDLQEGDIIRWYENETVMKRASVIFRNSLLL